MSQNEKYMAADHTVDPMPETLLVEEQPQPTLTLREMIENNTKPVFYVIALLSAIQPAINCIHFAVKHITGDYEKVTKDFLEDYITFKHPDASLAGTALGLDSFATNLFFIYFFANKSQKRLFDFIEDFSLLIRHSATGTKDFFTAPCTSETCKDASQTMAKITGNALLGLLKFIYQNLDMIIAMPALPFFYVLNDDALPFGDFAYPIAGISAFGNFLSRFAGATAVIELCKVVIYGALAVTRQLSAENTRHLKDHLNLKTAAIYCTSDYIKADDETEAETDSNESSHSLESLESTESSQVKDDNPIITEFNTASKTQPGNFAWGVKPLLVGSLLTAASMILMYPVFTAESNEGLEEFNLSPSTFTTVYASAANNSFYVSSGFALLFRTFCSAMLTSAKFNSSYGRNFLAPAALLGLIGIIALTGFSYTDISEKQTVVPTIKSSFVYDVFDHSLDAFGYFAMLASGLVCNAGAVLGLLIMHLVNIAQYNEYEAAAESSLNQIGDNIIASTSEKISTHWSRYHDGSERGHSIDLPNNDLESPLNSGKIPDLCDSPNKTPAAPAEGQTNIIIKADC